VAEAVKCSLGCAVTLALAKDKAEAVHWYPIDSGSAAIPSLSATAYFGSSEFRKQYLWHHRTNH